MENRKAYKKGHIFGRKDEPRTERLDVRLTKTEFDNLCRCAGYLEKTKTQIVIEALNRYIYRQMDSQLWDKSC